MTPPGSSRPRAVLPAALCALVLGAAGGGAGVWWWADGRAASLRSELASKDRVLDRLRAAGAAARARVVELGAENARVRGTLEGSIGREKVVAQALEQATAELAAARSERGGFDVGLVPEGVRLCVSAMHERFRDDGVGGLRFLRIRSVGEKELLGVELLDHDPRTLQSRVFVAERMTVTLLRGEGGAPPAEDGPEDRPEDGAENGEAPRLGAYRGASRLEMRLFDGRVSHGGGSETLPEEGWPIVVGSVDGPAWERALPYLVRATGAYPAEEGQGAGASRNPAMTLVWSQRLSSLLEGSDGELSFRLKGVRSVDGNVFVGLALAGYRGRALAFYGEGERAQIVVDDAAELVFLSLADGTIRDEVGKTKVGDEGYRVLLPGVRPATARSIMMGQVVLSR